MLLVRSFHSALKLSSLQLNTFKISRLDLIPKKNYNFCKFQEWNSQARTYRTSCKLFHSFNKSSVQPLLNFELRCHNSSNPNLKLPKQRKKDNVVGVTWKSVLITGALCGSLMMFMFYIKKKKDLEIEKERTRSLGKAKIGGKFDLIDHNGKPCKSEDFLGKWCLIYFGFTHCPDICPDELEKLGAVVDKIDESKIIPNGIHPLFITVDPARDSMEAVSKYVKEFHPKFLGLTGSVEKIAEACKSYRVYFSAGPKDDDEDYIVDHTIIIYLINPKGDFVDYFGQTRDVESIFNSIVLSYKKFEVVNKPSILNTLKFSS